MLIPRLARLIDRRDTMDADHALLLMSLQDLALTTFRAIRLAAFQQSQLARLAELVPAEHAAEAAMIVTRGNEVGEAVAGEFAEMFGPGLDELIAELPEETSDIGRI